MKHICPAILLAFLLSSLALNYALYTGNLVRGVPVSEDAITMLERTK